jgi:antitoxin MazE
MQFSTTIQTWGNSLAVKIPAALAKEAGLNVGAAVTLTTTTNGVLISPVGKKPRIKLSDLLSQCKGPNPHRELITRKTGKEIL